MTYQPLVFCSDDGYHADVHSSEAEPSRGGHVPAGRHGPRSRGHFHRRQLSVQTVRSVHSHCHTLSGQFTVTHCQVSPQSHCQVSPQSHTVRSVHSHALSGQSIATHCQVSPQSHTVRSGHSHRHTLSGQFTATCTVTHCRVSPQSHNARPVHSL